MDEETHIYTLVTPEDYKDVGPIFLTIETYPFDFIPLECTTDDKPFASETPFQYLKAFYNVPEEDDKWHDIMT